MGWWSGLSYAKWESIKPGGSIWLILLLFRILFSHRNYDSFCCADKWLNNTDHHENKTTIFTLTPSSSARQDISRRLAACQGCANPVRIVILICVVECHVQVWEYVRPRNCVLVWMFLVVLVCWCSYCVLIMSIWSFHFRIRLYFRTICGSEFVVWPFTR